MRQPRFGELLSRLVHLSGHDVDEILSEQNGSHRRFGEIALSLGMCTPENVWQAWCEQLLTQVQKVDLEALGIDAQAAAIIQREVAQRLNAIPIRCLENVLVVAIADSNTQAVAAELELTTLRELRFVVADAEQIRQAIEAYYPAAPVAA
jgi:type IV pilus assembly protein PilB